MDMDIDPTNKKMEIYCGIIHFSNSLVVVHSFALLQFEIYSITGATNKILKRDFRVEMENQDIFTLSFLFFLPFSSNLLYMYI